MMYSKRFCYYQPNKMDLKDKYGDCTIRALSKVFNCTWLEAFDMQVPLCRKYQLPNIFFAPAKTRNMFFHELGLTYYPVSNKRGTRRPTIDDFAKDHTQGRFLCVVANHIVAVVDGKYYDTWDSGHKSMYGWYELKA